MSAAGLKLRRFLFVLGLFVLGLPVPCLPVQAASVADLQAAGRLQLRSWLDPAENIIPGQQVKLVLEIATDRWFTGGTRIQIPEVPGLVILQTDDFASNSSEQRNAQSWVVQRWSLEVYPQREGNFTVPPVTARIKVNDEGSTAIEGEVTGPALQFTATRPESLARVEHWVAAPAYSATQSFDRALEGLQVGDAIERNIVFRAEEVMAMMLPPFTEEAIPGLRAYPEPPVLENSSNRGSILATRRERLTYIVEAAGKYQLPARDYFWWDTRTGELQLLSLPTVDILVGSGAAVNADEASPEKFKLPLLIAAAGVLITLMALLWLGRKLPVDRALQHIKAGFQILRQLLRQQWHTLRKPALPGKLNPGNSAGD